MQRSRHGPNAYTNSYSIWPHYLPRHGVWTAPQPTDSQSEATQLSQDCHFPKTRLQQDVAIVSPPSSPGLCVRSSEDSIVRTLSSSPMTAASNPVVNASIDGPGGVGAVPSIAIPRRNLQGAFEELYVDDPTVKANPTKFTPDVKTQDSNNVISPAGVTDFPVPNNAAGRMTPTRDKTANGVVVPFFGMHPDLKRDLSQDLVNRVSFYGIIHDINKEAMAMASNDESGFNKGPEEAVEKHDALIVAVNGKPDEELPRRDDFAGTAVIDEEKWLLAAIDSASEQLAVSAKTCPPTFLQAMGEREYENPLTSLSSGSRTQLWKPSRSWWEAKSGKNPWIEPKSHNKRWRYLWPLIHYHKFLAKCIKKLKRNGVDVKTSGSLVAVFLRQDVCAISDHLAAVSLFGSDEWMACLSKFEGWTVFDKTGSDRIRFVIGTLSLRSLQEPGDVDSPLLRSQIDAQFLRVMTASRVQMNAGASIQAERSKAKDSSSTLDSDNAKTSNASAASRKSGLPPAHPGMPAGPPAHYSNAPQGHWQYQPLPNAMYWAAHGWNYPPQPYFSHPYQHYQHGAPSQASYTDDTSVHSALSGDTNLSHHPYDTKAAMLQAHYHPHMVYPSMSAHVPPPGFPMAHMQSTHSVDSHDSSVVAPEVHGHQQSPPTAPSSNSSQSEQGSADGPVAWMGMVPQATPMWYPPHGYHDPGMYIHHPGQPLVHSPMHLHSHQPKVLDAATSSQQTPSKTPNSQVPPSPYWGHLDTVSGIVSPHGKSVPQTPQRQKAASTSTKEEIEQKDDRTGNAAIPAAQPLPLQPQYYEYGYSTAGMEYGPHSPATQFMMSPQVSAPYGYNYGYGFSPVKHQFQQPSMQRTPVRGEQRKKTRSSSTAKGKGSEKAQQEHTLNEANYDEGKALAVKESSSIATLSTEAEQDSHASLPVEGGM